MSKDLWLSQFNPDSVIQLDDVEKYPLDIAVINDQLTLLMSDSTPHVVGRFSGTPGGEVDDLVLLTDNRIQQKLSDGSITTFDRIRKDYVQEISVAEGSSGYYSGLIEQPTGNLLPTDKLVEQSMTAVVMDDGTIVRASSIWTSGYSVFKALNGTTTSNTDGLLWANNINPTLTVTFAYPRYIDEFLFRNMRTDAYRTTAFSVEALVPGSSDSWIVIDSVDVSTDLSGLHYRKLVNAILVSAVRLVITNAGTTAPSVGRFELYFNRLGDSEVTTYLANYKPFIIDPSKFDVTETESEIQLSLKTSDSGGDVNNYSTPLDVNNYLKANVTTPYSKWTYAGATKNLWINEVLTNTMGAKLDSGIIILEPGTYVAKAAAVCMRIGSVVFYLLNVNTGYPVGQVANSHCGTSLDVANTVFNNTILRLKERTPIVMTVVAGTTSGTTPTPVSPDDVRIEATLDLWKVSDQVDLDLTMAGDLDIPEESSGVMAPFAWLGGSLSGTGDGRGLFDKKYLNIFSGVDSAYWQSPGHRVVVRVDSNFRLWRKGISSWPTYSAELSILRIDDRRDYSDSHLPRSDNDGTFWSRFTDELPAGTYVFSHYGGLRIDSEWFIEAIPHGGTKKVGDYVSIYKPMHVAVCHNQVVSESSNSGGVWPAYRGHLAFKGHPRSNGTHCWISNTAASSVAAPQWLQIEFTDGPRELDRYVLVNRAATVTINAPRDWQLLGKNKADSDWTIIDTKIDIPQRPNGSRFGANVPRCQFEIYRLNVTRNWTNSGTNVVIESLELLKEI